MEREPLFTPRFFALFGFTFTVFLSLFQLLPTAPDRILAIGGSTRVAGLFLGFLTYSSALSAPFCGSIVDRLGQRRVLIVTSLVIAGFTTMYAFTTSHVVLLGLVLVHGVFWSALMTASGSYMTAILPESRRAEGLGYWGFASIIAIGVAPTVGFIVYHLGWFTMCLELVALNLLMTFMAWRLPQPPGHDPERHKSFRFGAHMRNIHEHIEWRVGMVSITLALVAFSYGALTSFSALFADAIGVTPRGIYLGAMAGMMILGRLLVGRRIDRIGHRRVLIPSLVTCTFGLLVTAAATNAVMLVCGGALFGFGFGLLWPAFAALMLKTAGPGRSGAAYGAMIAAFDTGIGTGSSVLGSLVASFGFRPALGVAAALAALAAPYFLFAEKRLSR
jgi:MFS family permease